MKKLFLLLAFLVLSISANAQTTSIGYTPYAAGFTGYGAQTSYTGANIDSVWTYLQANGTISGVEIYQATKQGTGGPAGIYRGSRDRLKYYIAAGNYTGGTVVATTPNIPQSVIRFISPTSVSAAAAADTGIVLLGVTTGNFVVTSAWCTTLDTSGYTSGATIKWGTNASSYNNIVSTMTTPTLGTTVATLVAPMAIIPTGTSIYAYITAVGTCTTRHIEAAVVGFYR